MPSDRGRTGGPISRLRARFSLSTVEEVAEITTTGEDGLDPDSVTAWKRATAAQTEVAFEALRRNAALNFFLRLLLFLTGLVALAATLVYTYNRGDAMVGELLGTKPETHFNSSRLLALVVPVILLSLLSGAAFALATFLQGRGANDFESGLDGISRLRREAVDGVSRARTLSYVLEEILNNARRAIRLQFWFSQSLFIGSLLFAAAAVIQGLASGVNLLTAGLGVGSLASLVVARATGAGREVTGYLADTTQLQLLVANATRQVNLMEQLLYQRIERVNKEEPSQVIEEVRNGVEEISTITNRAVQQIEVVSEPGTKNGAQVDAKDQTPAKPPQKPSGNSGSDAHTSNSRSDNDHPAVPSTPTKS